MTSHEANPGADRLRWIAKACIVLGITSLVRCGPELIAVVPRGPRLAYFALVALDLFIAGIWLKCGMALRKGGRGTLRIAALGGAVIFSHSIASALFVGPDLLRGLERLTSSDSRYFFMLSVTGSRFLIYAIEFLFWPYALLVLLKLVGQPEETPGAARSVRLATIAAFLIGGLLHCIYLSGVLGR